MLLAVDAISCFKIRLVSASLLCAIASLLRPGEARYGHHPANPIKLMAKRQGRPVDNYAAAMAKVHYNESYTPVKIDEKKDCALWDDKCAGNRTAALDNFFNDEMDDLKKDSCFIQIPDNYHNSSCTPSLSPTASASIWSKVKTWMREPACSHAWHEAKPKLRSTDMKGGCCGGCFISGPNVDVFYWPSPNADTSCLDVVGTEVAPPLEGAQTNCNYPEHSCRTLWAYTPTEGNPSHLPQYTMEYTSLNGIFFKAPLTNPWDIATADLGIAPGHTRSGE